MSQRDSKFQMGEGSPPIENPYAPDPRLADYSLSPSLVGSCLEKIGGMYRRLFGVKAAPADDHTRLLLAYRAFFQVFPEAGHWVVTVQNPTALITTNHWPHGSEVRRLSKHSIEDLPRVLVLFDESNVVDGVKRLTTRPLFEQCAFVVVPKKISRELREAAKIVFPEEMSRKIVPMKFLAKVLENTVAEQLKSHPDAV